MSSLIVEMIEAESTDSKALLKELVQYLESGPDSEEAEQIVSLLFKKRRKDYWRYFLAVLLPDPDLKPAQVGNIVLGQHNMPCEVGALAFGRVMARLKGEDDRWNFVMNFAINMPLQFEFLASQCFTSLNEPMLEKLFFMVVNPLVEDDKLTEPVVTMRNSIKEKYGRVSVEHLVFSVWVGFRWRNGLIPLKEHRLHNLPYSMGPNRLH